MRKIFWLMFFLANCYADNLRAQTAEDPAYYIIDVKAHHKYAGTGTPITNYDYYSISANFYQGASSVGNFSFTLIDGDRDDNSYRRETNATAIDRIVFKEYSNRPPQAGGFDLNYTLQYLGGNYMNLSTTWYHTPDGHRQGETLVVFDRFDIYRNFKVYPTGGDRTLSVTKTTRLQTNQNASYVSWQYTTDDPTSSSAVWKSVNVSLAGRELNISSIDLFGESVADYYGRMVYFRIALGPSGKYSNYEGLEVKPGTPRVTSSTVVAPLCHDNTGGVVLQFERALATGEQLQILWRSEDIQVVTALEAGNKLTITGLQPDNNILTVAGWNGAAAITETAQQIPLNIVNPPLVTFSLASKTDPLCHTDKGSFIINASGGTTNPVSAYTLHYKKGTNSWSEPFGNGNTTVNIPNLDGGTYEYYVKDRNSCSVDNSSGIPIHQSVAISAAPTPVVVTHTAISPTGYGKNNGQIEIRATGGTGPYNSITLKNSGGATVASVAGSNILLATGLVAGTYTAQAMDRNNCLSDLITIVLVQPDLLQITTSGHTNILCFGDATGKHVITPSGGVPQSGTGNYLYTWYKKNGGAFDQLFQFTGNTAEGLVAGSYKVKITDFSTLANTVEQTFDVTQPTQLVTTVLPLKNISCFGGSDGQIRIKVEGGTDTYKLFYKKSSDPSYTPGNLNTGEKTFYINNLAHATYQLYVRDGNNCATTVNGVDIASFVVAQPAKAITIAADRLYGVTAPGLSNGSISADIDGGTAPYNIEWKNQGGTIITPANTNVGGLVRSTISGLLAGKYTVTIKDANYTGATDACFVTKEYTLAELPALTATLNPTHILCNGMSSGQISVSVNGGLPHDTGSPYIYTWYKVTTTDELISGATGSVLANIVAGKYKVKIKDAAVPFNQIEREITIIQPSALTTTTLPLKHISCFDGSDGQIRIKVEGGTDTYKLFYKKASESSYTVGVLNGVDRTFYVNNLSQDTYNLYVRDGNNCETTINGEAIASITLNQPSKAMAIFSDRIYSSTASGLDNGKVIAEFEGGTLPYTIEWKRQGGGVVGAVNTNVGNKVQSVATGLAPGKYTVTVKDSNYTGAADACFITKEYTVDELAPLNISINLTHNLCYGESMGHIASIVTGGLPHTGDLSYIYSWYKVSTIGDELIPTEVGTELSALPSGKYKLKVRDAADPFNEKVSDVLTINEPPLLTTTVSTRNIYCFEGDDGYIRVHVQGGVGNYKFYYKQVGVDSNYREQQINPSDQTFYLNNLVAGTYSMYLRDGNDCYASINGQEFADITLTQPQKALEITSVFSSNVTGYGRNDGTMTIHVEGGTPNTNGSYIVVWKNERGDTFAGINKIVAGRFSNTLDGQPAGTYTVEVRDTNYAGSALSTNSSCLAGASFNLTQPDLLVVNITEEHFVSCNGSNDGILEAHVRGGIPRISGLSYKYKWFLKQGSVYSEITDATNKIFGNLKAGHYKVEITDYSIVPNITSIEYTLSEPEVLNARFDNKDIGCGETTSLSAIVAGGTQPYSYEWSTGDTYVEINNLYPGKYSVFVTDVRKCQTAALGKVSSPSDLEIASSNIIAPTCYGNSNGSVSITVKGGRAPYIYTWSNGATTQNISNLKGGHYAVLITDQAGCSYYEDFMVREPDQLTVSLGDDRTLCRGQELILEPVVKETISKFSWTGSNGFRSTSSKVSISQEGLYSLTITDNKGCQAKDDINIKYKDLEISSEMVVASQVYAQDTIVIVNISDPDPDRIEWLLPENINVQIVETEGHFAKVIFNEPGLYQVGIRSYVQDCYQDMMKTITVLDPDDNTNPDRFGQSIIKKYIIYPNPNSGIFNVDIELNRQSAIRLRLINIGTGRVVDDRRLNGSEKYTVPYNLNLGNGTFTLLLESATGRMVLKMIAI